MFKCDAFSFSKKFLFSATLFFSLGTGFASENDIFQYQEKDKPLHMDSPKLLKILSIDGGGIRGIIPATLLERLEKLTNKPIAKSFEVMSGTSTGGILTLGLNIGDKEKVPLYTASNMVDIYSKRGSEIFQQSIYRKIACCMGLLSYKYSSDGLTKLATELLGDQKLSDCVTNTIITSYEIEKDEPYFFKSVLAKMKKEDNFYMRDIVRATSAAPTYFQPCRIENFEGDSFSFIDGGVVLNNPTLSATIHGKNLFPLVKPTKYMVVSLGTGNTTRSIRYDNVKNSGGLGWVGKIIPLMMDGASHVVDYQMSHIMPDTEGMKNYFRFQPNIPSDLSEMDNVHPENIKRLQMIAEKSANYYFDDLLKLIAKNIQENRKFSSNILFTMTPKKTERKNSIFFNSDPQDKTESILDLTESILDPKDTFIKKRKNMSLELKFNTLEKSQDLKFIEENSEEELHEDNTGSIEKLITSKYEKNNSNIPEDEKSDN